MADVERSHSRKWYFSAWFIGVLALLAGIALGAASVMSDPADSTEYQRAEAGRAAAENRITELEAELATVEGDLPQREAALAKRTSELAEREKAIKQAEKDIKEAKADLDKRERAVGIVEQEIADNTIDGSGGVYRIGRDVKPGLYRSVENEDCYWMITNDPNGNDIVANDIVSGPALAELPKGKYFTTRGCGDWILQR